MAKTARRQSLLSQLISTILRDKPPRMLVRLPTLRLRELSMSQPPLLSLSVLIRLMVKSLLFMILEVVLSIFPFLKFQEVSLKLRPPMVTPLLEEKISISAFNNSLLLNSNLNTVWILPPISLLFKELEKLPRRQRLNFHLPLKLKSILLIFPLMLQAQNICN